jgi:flavin reductase (DIM6/NTAB) family NADH-FMN oxidoreductase RutF
MIPREIFRRTCARFATGIAVVTATTPDGTPHGVTVNSFTSVSCEPPILSICLDLKCSILGEVSGAKCFGINILSRNQQDISARFAQSCDPRFEGIDWQRGRTGVPLLSGVLASFECRRISTLEVGDHAIILGEVESAVWSEGEPLIYFGSRYRVLEP